MRILKAVTGVLLVVVGSGFLVAGLGMTNRFRRSLDAVLLGQLAMTLMIAIALLRRGWRWCRDAIRRVPTPSRAVDAD
jgi:hypothetical protein